ncbi:MAG: hypothetical protein ABI840_03740 [bacterium]
MKSSNLILMMGKLNAAEFKEFGEYTRSSYFNKSEGVIKLYEYIKIHYPDFDEIKMGKENVFRNILPDIEYDDAFMRKLMFNLSKLTEDFLVHENIKKDSFNYSKALLNELMVRDLKKLYTKKLKSINDEFIKQKIKNNEYYKNKYIIDSINESVVMKDKMVVNSKDRLDMYLNNHTKSMIEYFLVEILCEYRFLINYKKIVRFDFNPAFYEIILNYMKKNESVHNVPLLSLYYNSLLLIIEKEKMHFQKLKELLIKEMSSFSWHDKYGTFAILVNFINDEYHKGNKQYANEGFELYKLIIQYKLYSGKEGGHFENALFKNIVKLGLLMKETDWTEKFINDYIEELLPEARDNTLYYSKARVNFAKGNYERSLEDLSKIVSIHDFHFKSQIKSLTLMIFIEKSWINEAFDLIDASKHYISYEKLLPEITKEKNMNFIKFCTEILKMKSKNSKEKINDLKYDLLNTENILEKEWLEEKIEELERIK